MKLSLLIAFVVIVCFAATNARPQGWSWGSVEDENDSGSQPSRPSRPVRPTRPVRPIRQTTATTSAPPPSSTTTASNEQMINCQRNCPATPEYNPVCGSDGRTYMNRNRLNCAVNCGLTGVSVAFIGCCQGRCS